MNEQSTTEICQLKKKYFFLMIFFLSGGGLLDWMYYSNTQSFGNLKTFGIFSLNVIKVQTVRPIILIQCKDGCFVYQYLGFISMYPSMSYPLIA